MAPSKRRPDKDSDAQLFANSTKHKKARKEPDSARAPPKNSKSVHEDQIEKPTSKQTQRSLLQDEERAFPRGGANVLTPLEHKQIKIEAERDVLFETSASKENENASGAASGRKRSSHDFDNESAQENRRRKRKRSQSASKTTATDPEDHVKIEGLSFRRLVPGSQVLGQISQITSRDVALTLPNNLTGFVPLTSVSDTLNRRIEEILNKEDGNDETEASENEDDIQLQHFFRLGQYLRACVTANTNTDGVAPQSTSRMKRRIELSVNPAQTNAGMDLSDVAPGDTVQAAVSSIEDRGFVMDLGSKSTNIRGFVPLKEMPNDLNQHDVEEGTVWLCVVTGVSTNATTVQLAAKQQEGATAHQASSVSSVKNKGVLLPGTAVRMVVTAIVDGGVSGSIAGMMNATADQVHSRQQSGVQGKSSVKAGSKLISRIIFSPQEGEDTVSVSLLPNVLALSQPLTKSDSASQPVSELLPLSTIVEDATVSEIWSKQGLVFDVGIAGLRGFAHISRLSDKKIDSLSAANGPYQIGSRHRARVVGYNSVDDQFLLSLEQSVLEQPFLRIEDVKVGQKVTGTVEKLILNTQGVAGLLVNLADGITGFVPEMHLADIKLQHPERKYKDGMRVTARVLSIDTDKRAINLTLKKSLINLDKVWSDWNQISEGSRSTGTLVNLSKSGALVRFFGAVRAFLPISEMSKAYIEDPQQHFRIGQDVQVNVRSVNAEQERMIVSCKEPSGDNMDDQSSYDGIKLGTFVEGKVTATTDVDVKLELVPSGIPAILRLGHLTDGSEPKSVRAAKHVRVGQKLQDLLVLEKYRNKRLIVLSKKPSLAEAAKSGTSISGFEDVVLDQTVEGYVRNIIAEGVFVQFLGDLVGFLPKQKIQDAASTLPNFGLHIDQSIKAHICFVDTELRRFTLSMKEKSSAKAATNSPKSKENAAVPPPLDDTSIPLNEFSVGSLVQVKVSSVKRTQLNVKLADNVNGRIDVSEVFDSWDDIADKRNPLAHLRKGDTISTKVIGFHNSRTHRFLPFSHRTGVNTVFELTAKPSHQAPGSADILTIDQMTIGLSLVGFINNITIDKIWVTISPKLKGVIDILNISEDVSVLKDVESHFPIGSAVKVRVKSADALNSRLELVPSNFERPEELTIDNISEGMIIPGQVAKVSEYDIYVRLSSSISGSVGMTQLADDYSQANPAAHEQKEIVRVCVVEVDKAAGKVQLSLRPSKVLSSSMPVIDPHVVSISQLKVNDIVRGFVKLIMDKGLIVRLSPTVEAFVHIRDLSDEYLKDWKSAFKPEQLVRGKVINTDAALGHIQLSLKASLLDKNYVASFAFEDMKRGQIVHGKVRKAESFGVFIVVDNSRNVSGLCHRTEIADATVADATKVYEEGDRVKAIVLKVDLEKRRISFGLKASYFKEDDAEDADEALAIFDENGTEEGGVSLDNRENDSRPEERADEERELNQNAMSSEEGESASEGDEAGGEESEHSAKRRVSGTAAGVLEAGGFDWGGDGDTSSSTAKKDFSIFDGEPDHAQKPKQKRSTIEVDRTGDLDRNGPQSSDDFERRLLGQPNSSSLWIQYMAYALQLNEIQNARDIAERALKTINIREEEDKSNIWIALLNLENTYGDDNTLESVFKRAYSYTDSLEMHEKLVSIYIDSGKFEKADELFQTMTRNKAFTPSETLWLNYATFLMTSLQDPDRARALLQRASQSVPEHLHRHLTTRFAALEFTSPNGEPERGRTIFEGLMAAFPKKWDLWDQFVDLERSKGESENVRGLYERMTAEGVKMKPRRAKFVFKRWLEFEEKEGSGKQVEYVKKRAEKYVEGLKGGDGVIE
ncbi:MAG: rRNA biogenesis protein rrp5 [Bogoriella megaspora]|nr:MAG: rRNA biogenesis protein rrp5 [Bogoriella megaspora]